MTVFNSLCLISLQLPCLFILLASAVVLFPWNGRRLKAGFTAAMRGELMPLWQRTSVHGRFYLLENIIPQPLLSFREHPSTGFYLLSHILTYYYFPDTPTHPTMRGACPLTWARAWKGELWWNWGVGSFEEEVKMGRSRKESRTGPSISLKGDHKLDWMNNCSTSIMFRRALRSTKFSGHREGDKSWVGWYC